MPENGVGIKGGMGNEEMGNMETRKWGNEERAVKKLYVRAETTEDHESV